MKLKCRPDDFVVTERLKTGPSVGSFALYRLSKTDLGTPEAIAQIRRSWNLDARRVAHAGLKDRHAVTHQYITVRNGPQTDLRQDRFSLEYCGQTGEAVSAARIDGNHFQIIVRQLTQPQASQIVNRVSSAGGVAVPNYFDQQRFGSLGYSGEYVAAAWCRRDYERATWLALADPNPHDRSSEKEQKEILRDHWGDWVTCKQQLQRSHRRSIVTYLVDHPVGFRKAFGLIRSDLRGLFLSAFQSAVWNRMLGRMLEQEFPEFPTTDIADASLPFGCLASASVSSSDQTLPLVSARSRNLPEDVRRHAAEATECYGLRPEEMKLSWPRDRFFSRGNRRCWLVPDSVTADIADDDIYEGSQRVRLEFELPSGSYATMLIRGLTSDLKDHQS